MLTFKVEMARYYDFFFFKNSYDLEWYLKSNI